MSQQDPSDPDKRPSEFEQAGRGKPLSLPQEFLLFVIENKAWWLVPIGLALAAIGALAALTATGAAPFIYTFF